MAISLMTWKPDTCDCEIEESHNPADSSYGVKFSKIFSKCPEHQSVSDNDIYDIVYANSDSEQKRKNQLEGHLLETEALGLSEEVTQEDGSKIRQFKSGIKYEWSFTGEGANRILDVTMRGISMNAAALSAINVFAASKFGSNRVSIK